MFEAVFFMSAYSLRELPSPPPPCLCLCLYVCICIFDIHCFVLCLSFFCAIFFISCACAHSRELCIFRLNSHKFRLISAKKIGAKFTQNHAEVVRTRGSAVGSRSVFQAYVG